MLVLVLLVRRLHRSPAGPAASALLRPRGYPHLPRRAAACDARAPARTLEWRSLALPPSLPWNLDRAPATLPSRDARLAPRCGPRLARYD